MSYRNHVPAACLTAVLMGGCASEAPDLATVTRPASDAFTRLATWRPWQPPQSGNVPPALPVDSAPLAPPVPQAAAPQPQVAVQRGAAPRVSPALARRPVRGQEVPPAISCQTIANPGQRVRMECRPVD